MCVGVFGVVSVCGRVWACVGVVLTSSEGQGAKGGKRENILLHSLIHDIFHAIVNPSIDKCFVILETLDDFWIRHNQLGSN